MITEGKKVNIVYSIHYSDHTSALDNEEEKLEFIQGDNEILPALETALEGLNVGDVKKITLSPSEAYGPIDDEHFIIIDINQIPKKDQFIDARIFIEDKEGDVTQGKIVKINEQQAIIDLNHPLAGKTLTYTIKVLSITNGYILH